ADDADLAHRERDQAWPRSAAVGWNDRDRGARTRRLARSRRPRYRPRDQRQDRQRRGARQRARQACGTLRRRCATFAHVRRAERRTCGHPDAARRFHRARRLAPAIVAHPTRRIRSIRRRLMHIDLLEPKVQWAQWILPVLRRDLRCLNALDWRIVALLFVVAFCFAIHSLPADIFLNGLGAPATAAEYVLAVFTWFVRYLVQFGPVRNSSGRSAARTSRNPKPHARFSGSPPGSRGRR